MKRRSFITGILAGVGLLTIPLSVVHAVEPSPLLKDQLLFNRFFEAANGFVPNEDQKKWFVNYSNGEHDFKSNRKTGMTTFMLTLALFETKCNATPIGFFASNAAMLRTCRERVRKMEIGLGNFSGAAFIYHTERNQKIQLPDVKIFVMDDAHKFPETFDINTYAPEQVYFFGTRETSPY